MGCDIHLLFEKKNPLGIWEKIEIGEKLLPDDRIYSLFGFLAGVRDHDQTPQFEDRGIPLDASIQDPDTEDFWLGDWGYTYAYLDEILDAPWEEAGLDNCYFHIFCREVLPRLAFAYGIMSNEDKRSVRVIMGFDN